VSRCKYQIKEYRVIRYVADVCRMLRINCWQLLRNM